MVKVNKFRNEYTCVELLRPHPAIPATSAVLNGDSHMKLSLRGPQKEDIVSDCLMIKLEGDSIKDFNESIQYWFDVVARRPGGVKQWKISSKAKKLIGKDIGKLCVCFDSS